MAKYRIDGYFEFEGTEAEIKNEMEQMERMVRTMQSMGQTGLISWKLISMKQVG